MADGPYREGGRMAHAQVDDMMSFENIGFTKTLVQIKYLCCADCELGPLGLQYLDRAPAASYLAARRVRYDVPEADRAAWSPSPAAS